ncbi:hypothetical protein N7481_001350 [Penicillium waksmanii]|uniref:uncharacterized protein n=1 Tax=Penicillium waksmanii TaxID=69791 RepID=UPI002548CD4E|nr:uncharacterized protein N7481_001350 [Penicillium waksmanii]KAJ6000941.1 hypothetical protein N7481_001350 [Penicillium waksmanii]
MYKSLKFVLGSFDCCGLVADDIFQGADELPHLLGRDPTRRIRWCKGIAASNSFPILVQRADRVDDGSSLVVVPCDAGDGFLVVCGMGLPQVGPPSICGYLPLGTQRRRFISR